MNTDIVIQTENDPALIVKVFAARFNRNLKNPGKTRLLKSLKGKFALSFTDGQKLTIDPDKGGKRKGGKRSKTIYLERGVHKDAKLVIHLDAENPNANPKIDGLYLHPFLALKLGKLLDDADISWTQAAEEFWIYAKNDEKFPQAIKILATDCDEHLLLGEGETEMEIEASSKSLATLFSGSAILLEEALKGKIRVYATMEKQVEFTRVNLKYMLGT